MSPHKTYACMQLTWLLSLLCHARPHDVAMCHSSQQESLTPLLLIVIGQLRHAWQQKWSA